MKKKESYVSETKYRVTFTEDLLGTAPLNKQIYADFVMSKKAEASEDELNSVPERDERGTTGFHRDEAGNPILYDYMIKGFCKDACSMLARVEGTYSKGCKAHKKKIDGLIFVYPRKLKLNFSGEIGTLERPLRASTPQGERVALVKSEVLPAGTWFEMTLRILGDEVDEDLLKEWLDYGQMRGIGQWRNASYGRFDYAVAKP